MISLMGLAQTKTITGSVSDEGNGETLPAVSVYWKEDVTRGTSTDFDGNFSLELPVEAQVIVFSYVGYQNLEYQLVDGQNNISIQLSESNNVLNDVVVSASKRSEKILDAPASVSVIGTEKIANTAAITPTDHLKRTPGVDIMQTGLASANVNVRGFNGIFSGSLLSLVDYRIARVPSLKVNAYQLIPVNNQDIERIELVRGPGSALYGPNAADGVLHIFTKSPLDMEVGEYETSLSVGVGFKQGTDTLQEFDDATNSITTRGYDFGERLVYHPEFRHAGRISEKFGYKISGQYQKGNDWVTYDPREPQVGDSIQFGSVTGGEVFQPDSPAVIDRFARDFGVERIAGEVRFDYQPTEDITTTVNGGFTRGSNVELTGLGAGQAVDWTYWYGQARVRYKDLFFQYFVNSSDANDTYLIPQSGPLADGDPPVPIQRLVDISKLHTLTLQHNSSPIDELRLTYGADALLTRPNTEGTINGRFEDADNLSQYGIYFQGEYRFNDKWKIVAALRGDYTDPIDEFQISPRAALVYKPAPKHTLRATFNRAFTSPSVLNIGLDLSNGAIPTPDAINIRGIGNPSGYEYLYGGDSGTDPLWFSPYGLTTDNSLDINGDGIPDNYFNIFDPSVTDNNYLFLEGQMTILREGLAGAIGLPGFLLIPFTDQLLEGVGGASGSINTVDLLAIDYATIATGGSIADATFDLVNSPLSNFGPVESTITQTIELGYKALLANDKLFFNLDAYYTQIDNFVTPLTTVAPAIIFNPDQLAGLYGGPAAGELLYDNIEALLTNPTLGPILAGLDGDPAYSDPDDAIPTVEGHPWDEVMFLLINTSVQLTNGTITPQDPDGFAGNDAILTYRNIEDAVRVFGADLGFTYLINDGAQLTGGFSWVSKDSIPVAGAAGGFIGLNAPKYKMQLGYDHKIKDTGLGLGATFRWNAGFYANSAVYVGPVESYNVLDARVSYTPKFAENTRVLLDMSNVLGITYTTFPGVPEFGRLTMLKIQQTF
jgi:iron complex outermembrane receptor protein